MVVPVNQFFFLSAFEIYWWYPQQFPYSYQGCQLKQQQLLDTLKIAKYDWALVCIIHSNLQQVEKEETMHNMIHAPDHDLSPSLRLLSVETSRT
mmetsp:Transcript_14555/g.31308  ORF Transcript_14555/g.31308 Transcript_14555/m.31308 type:complete len:94 (+) Transcript_14555:1428-1709(+)